MSNIKSELYGHVFTETIAFDSSKMKHIECRVTLQKDINQSSIIYRVFYGKARLYIGKSLEEAIEAYEKI